MPVNQGFFEIINHFSIKITLTQYFLQIRNINIEKAISVHHNYNRKNNVKRKQPGFCKDPGFLFFPCLIEYA